MKATQPRSKNERFTWHCATAVPKKKHGMLRIVDESGEDYLYPRSLFRSIALPQAIRKAVLAAA
jgi:hypothetical protein